MLAYLVDSFTSLLSCRATRMLFLIHAAPAGLGELAIMLWLLIKGTKASADPAFPRAVSLFYVGRPPLSAGAAEKGSQFNVSRDPSDGQTLPIRQPFPPNNLARSTPVSSFSPVVASLRWGEGAEGGWGALARRVIRSVRNTETGPPHPRVAEDVRQVVRGSRRLAAGRCEERVGVGGDEVQRRSFIASLSAGLHRPVRRFRRYHQRQQHE